MAEQSPYLKAYLAKKSSGGQQAPATTRSQYLEAYLAKKQQPPPVDAEQPQASYMDRMRQKYADVPRRDVVQDIAGFVEGATGGLVRTALEEPMVSPLAGAIALARGGKPLEVPRGSTGGRVVGSMASVPFVAGQVARIPALATKAGAIGLGKATGTSALKRTAKRIGRGGLTGAVEANLPSNAEGTTVPERIGRTALFSGLGAAGDALISPVAEGAFRVLGGKTPKFLADIRKGGTKKKTFSERVGSREKQIKDIEVSNLAKEQEMADKLYEKTINDAPDDLGFNVTGAKNRILGVLRKEGLVDEAGKSVAGFRKNESSVLKGLQEIYQNLRKRVGLNKPNKLRGMINEKEFEQYANKSRSIVGQRQVKPTKVTSEAQAGLKEATDNPDILDKTQYLRLRSTLRNLITGKDEKDRLVFEVIRDLEDAAENKGIKGLSEAREVFKKSRSGGVAGDVAKKELKTVETRKFQHGQLERKRDTARKLGIGAGVFGSGLGGLLYGFNQLKRLADNASNNRTYNAT